MFTIFYIIIGILWGTYSTLLQQLFINEKISSLETVLIFIINAIIFPISMIIAINEANKQLKNKQKG